MRGFVHLRTALSAPGSYTTPYDPLMSRHDQITTLHDLSQRYEALTGTKGFLHSRQRNPGSTEWYVFADGRTIPDVDLAIEYARALVAKAERAQGDDHAPPERDIVAMAYEESEDGVGGD